MDHDKYATINRTAVGELVRMVDDDLNPILASPTLSTVRTHTSPLMGTYARAAKRRIDSESGPVRIEGTDTFNQPMQHIYQNSRQITNDQMNNLESRRLMNKQIDDRVKFPSSNYDAPPRKDPSTVTPQKIITTITTTTTTTPAKQYQSNTSLNEASVPVDRLFEHAVELQKLGNLNSNSSKEPLVIERKEQYQVFMGATDRDQTHPVTRSGQATDLDQAQADRLVDDHQAIQHLTRALQEHNTTTLNEYKRLPSQTTPIVINTTTTTTRIPSTRLLVDQPIPSEFSVIDALLHNPLGTNNPKQNSKLQTRFNTILTNLRNADYVNALKESTRKVVKKKKTKKSSKDSPKGPPVDKQTQITEAMIDPNLVSTEQTSLINSADQDKPNKFGTKNSDYQVVDAVIGSPISYRLPDAYLTKYRTNPPLSQSFLPSSITGKNDDILLSQQSNLKAKPETVNGLVKVVNDLTLHHAAALTASVPSTTNNLPQSASSGYSHQVPVQRSTNHSSESVKPRILYRYIDEHGNVLKISPVAPSQLKEIVSERSQRNPTEGNYVNNRSLIVEDERNTLWSNQSRLPKGMSREDYNPSEKRPTARTIPVTIEREYPPRVPLPQSQPFHPHSNEETIQTTWLPRSQKLEPPRSPMSGQGGYDTDTTDSEHSTTYRSNEYPQRGYPQRTVNPPVRPYDPSPSRLVHGNQRISPDYTRAVTPRNYIEVFRDGDVKPSEIYSLPFNDSSSTIDRHSRYDQYQSNRQGRPEISSVSPSSNYVKSIPTLSNRDGHPSQHSPTRNSSYLDSHSQPTKVSEYRPLRTKLQREYKITPSLLVDEWDLPETPTSPDYQTQPNLTSADDVFMTSNRTYKA